MWQISRPPCEWWEFRWVFKNGLLPIAPKWADSDIFFGQNYFKFNLSRGYFYQKIKIWDRVTESQTLKCTQYTGGGNIFVPDFNKLPYSLRLQGDKCPLQGICIPKLLNLIFAGWICDIFGQVGPNVHSYRFRCSSRINDSFLSQQD